ncbi:primase-helicase family protein [Brevundimonas sp. DWR2-3-1b1]|uniref:primase-helicase family protein n=1 Tax=unclassified Brevundimonas TaxID=2622653 RepID=UPI003CF3C84F
MSNTDNMGAKSPLEKIKAKYPNLHYQIADSQMKAMDYANKRIAQIKLGGKVRFLDRTDRQLAFYSFHDMATILAHETVLIVGWEVNEGKKVPVAKPVPLFRWWACQSDRRQYSEKVFLPYRPSGQAVGLPDGAFNTFQGFAYKPAFSSGYDLFKEHVNENLAGGDPVLAAWLWDFMADIFKNPTKRPPVMLILRGSKGSGKSTFSNVLAKLIGERYCPVIDSAVGLTGRFAGETFAHAMLLVVEEAYFAGDLASEARLKSLVTSPRLPVEEKHGATTMQPAYFRLVMTANAEHVVPSGPGERRFVVADVADHRKGDSKFFADMWAELEAGGFKTLLADLCARDLRNRDWSKPPKTAALADQVRLSLKSDERWWASILTTGVVPYERLPEGAVADADAEWSLDAPLVIARAHLLASYQQNCRAYGGSLSPESLGRFLRKVVGDSLSSVKATFPFRGRVNCYRLPSRREALASMQGAYPGLMLSPEADAEDLDAAMPREAPALSAEMYDVAVHRAPT